MRCRLIQLCCCLLLALSAGAQCDPVPDLFHGERVYDGYVNAMKMDSNELYAAGAFRLTGRYSGSFKATDAAGTPLSWTRFNGSGKITPDGNQVLIGLHERQLSVWRQSQDAEPD